MQPRRVTWHHIRTRLCQVQRGCQQRQRRRQRQLEQLSRAYRIRQHRRRPDCNKVLTLDRHEIVAAKPSTKEKRAAELRETFDLRLSSSRISSSSSSLLLIIFWDFYVPDHVSRMHRDITRENRKRRRGRALADPCQNWRLANFSLYSSLFASPI